MEKKSFNIPVYLYFIVGALLVIFLFPSDYVFGKHVSKDEEKRAQEEFLQMFEPLFRLDADVVSRQMVRVGEQEFDVLDGEAYRSLIVKLLKQVYGRGIVSIGDYLYLQENGVDSIVLFNVNGREKYPVSDLFTLKSAYSHIYNNLLNDSYIRPDADDLQRLNLNSFLTENIVYDKVASDKARKEGQNRIARQMNIQRQYGYIGGVVIIVSGLFACFFFYFYYLRRKIYKRKKDVFFSLMMAVLFIVATEICINFHIRTNIYIIPYAIIPIVVRTFFDSRTAQFTHLIAITVCSLMSGAPFEFILMQLIVCMVIVYVLKDLTRRSELIKCSFFILGTYVLTYIGLLLFRDGNFSDFRPLMLLYFFINFIFVMFAYPFIYILEKIFGYISNVTLVELSDINSPVLRELSEICPGTFQHSLQISMLAAAAAPKIKANPQLVRTGALYHDIGKIQNPQYFIENRLAGQNPHDKLTPEESAKIITSHVPEGVKIAEKHNLPAALIHFIHTHHGKGKTKYFYNTFKNTYPDSPVDESLFTYDGENPDTRESALLMMADAVEAASRSLTDYSEESLKTLINHIIDGQIADGLLNDSPLTFKNIRDVKQIFLEKLLSIYHLRIAYPEEKEREK
ncbi:MAG: HDIG domain-containing protein [Dysgonamonadaceae bacterium]|nr:HDIG domain-containing protein [Dysgonamonadaceae bacterium]